MWRERIEIGKKEKKEVVRRKQIGKQMRKWKKKSLWKNNEKKVKTMNRK